MIKVSQQAATVLVESLRQSGVGPEQGLRLQRQGSSYSLEVDSPNDEDEVIRHENSVVLIVEPQVSDEIGDALIDIADSPEGPRLVMRPLEQGEDQEEE